MCKSGTKSMSKSETKSETKLVKSIAHSSPTLKGETGNARPGYAVGVSCSLQYEGTLVCGN